MHFQIQTLFGLKRILGSWIMQRSPKELVRELFIVQWFFVRMLFQNQGFVYKKIVVNVMIESCVFRLFTSSLVNLP